MENGSVAAVSWLEIIEFWGLRVIICGEGVASGSAPKVSNRNSTLKLLILRDLSFLEVGKSPQKYRREIIKLLILRGLSFSGSAKRREKYRIEIKFSATGALGGMLGLPQGRGEHRVRLADEGGL
jgi:hypothetical protein